MKKTLGRGGEVISSVHGESRGASRPRGPKPVKRDAARWLGRGPAHSRAGRLALALPEPQKKASRVMLSTAESKSVQEKARVQYEVPHQSFLKFCVKH